MGLKQSCLGVCVLTASIGSEECYVSTRGHEERRLSTLIRFCKEKLLLIWLLICCCACERINNHGWPKIRWEGHGDRCWCDLKKRLLRSSSWKSRSDLIPVFKIKQLTALRATKSRNWKYFSQYFRPSAVTQMEPRQAPTLPPQGRKKITKISHYYFGASQQ